MRPICCMFAAMAGLCFVGGLFILIDEGDNDYGTTRNIYRMD